MKNLQFSCRKSKHLTEAAHNKWIAEKTNWHFHYVVTKVNKLELTIVMRKNFNGEIYGKLVQMMKWTSSDKFKSKATTERQQQYILQNKQKFRYCSENNTDRTHTNLWLGCILSHAHIFVHCLCGIDWLFKTKFVTHHRFFGLRAWERDLDFWKFSYFRKENLIGNIFSITLNKRNKCK